MFVEKRAHKAEMIVHAPGQTFRALATAADLYSAIDLASDKIDAQLRKHKERIKTRHKAKASETLSGMALPGRAFAVVRQPVDPMTPESAIQEMEDKGHQFFTYLDQETDQIHVVFRRGDETFAVVQPVRKPTRRVAG